MGSRLLSVRGEGPWKGYTRLNVNDRGQARLLRLENGYVSADGSEIRAMPGWVTILDLTDENNQLGYGRRTKDVVKPIYATSPAETYQYKQVDLATVLTQDVEAKRTHLHAFEQCGGELVIIGETRFRVYPMAAVGGGTVALLSVSRDSGTGKWRLAFSASVAQTGSTTDSGGAGLDYTNTDSILYVEGVVTADEALNAFLDANLNGRMHAITSITTNVIVLTTDADPSATTVGTSATAGSVRRILPNLSNVYSTNGTLPYDANYLNRPNDPDALTTWRPVAPLSLDNPQQSCTVAYVANRRRDIGDATGTNTVDGWFHPSHPGRGVSRRSMRKLPFRVCPEPASDRVILAVPGYGCMFQIPMRVPVDDAFPFGGASGLNAPTNSLRDMPRSLGIPKARLVQPAFMDLAQGSVTTGGASRTVALGDSFVVIPWVVAGPYPHVRPTLNPGTWQMCITYYDAATGEEGPASEVVLVDFVGGSLTTVNTLVLHIVHPGYVMGECLATHVRVYIAEPTSDVLKYYMTAPIDFVSGTRSGAYPSGGTPRANYQSGSSEYGLVAPGSPTHPNHWFCHFNIPWPGDDTNLNDSLVPDIQPRTVSMPRGASAARMVRGVLLSGGARGNFGRYFAMWRAQGSIGHGDPGFSRDRPDEIFVRTYGSDVRDASQMDGSPGTSLLGIAGRTFPDAYQGIEVIAPTLLPAGHDRQIITHVGNRIAYAIRFAPYNPPTPFSGGGYGRTMATPSLGIHTESNHERLRLLDPWAQFRRAVAVTPVSPAPPTFARLDQDIFFLMPQGQLQVGDPGAPQFAAAPGIKVFDSSHGDDITAIGRMASMAYVCSRRETYSLTWYRSAIGEELNLVTNEHGCVASNSMVEFDGGLAWLSERGPVAVSAAGPDFIGAAIADDFYGLGRRYLTDSEGLMRHAWGCHDQSRGLVLWGLVTRDHTHQIQDEGTTYSFDPNTPDEVLSRFPCDEILVWSYRANAFSTWRMPAGMEVLWMRPLRDESGSVRVCFLAADGRIYALDDEWNDRNGKIEQYGLTSPAITANEPFAVQGPGVATTTLSFVGANAIVDGSFLTGPIPKRNAGLLLAPGQLVEILDPSGSVQHRTTIASIVTASPTGGTTTIEMASAATWARDAMVRVAGRPAMTIVTTFFDGLDSQNMTVSGVQLRYGMLGEGHLNVRATLIKPEYLRAAPGNLMETRLIEANSGTVWPALGRGRTDLSETGRQTGQRAIVPVGAAGPEIALRLEVTGTPQIRLQDLSMELV